MKLKQFDIWLSDLEPHFGSEQGGKRPVVVLETNGVQGKGSTTIVAPLSSQIERVFSYDVVLNPSVVNGLRHRSKLMFRQVRVIDKMRLKRKMGVVEKAFRPLCRERLKLLFDLEPAFED
jgi:mRNA interferase MazF